jgi:hypothetical protein
MQKISSTQDGSMAAHNAEKRDESTAMSPGIG